MAISFYSEFTQDMDLLELTYMTPLERNSIPQLKSVNSQYKKLALVMHPDKGGNKESFQLLSQSFLRLSTFIANLNDEVADPNDTEEIDLRKFFQKYNVIIENSGSTTIFLENGLETPWETVLIAKYGNPKITPSGKSWKTDFSIDNIVQRKITITKWDQPKSDGFTKMCIQR